MSDDTQQPFDRRAVRRHRDRAAKHIGDHDFLFREAAARLAERLDDMRHDFRRALLLGARDGFFADAVRKRLGAGGLLVQADFSPALIGRAEGPRVAADEERLPFRPECFDLVVALPSLHWVNDLPGALIQCRRSLVADGLFLGAMFGGETLADLRRALITAEAERRGGASPRVSPFADVADIGALLQRAGLALPVVDRETLTVDYPDALALMRDLSAMGEANALTVRGRGLTAPAVLARAAALYRERAGTANGRIKARFDLLFMAAWAPAESQPKPLRPGSADRRLADALNTPENPLTE